MLVVVADEFDRPVVRKFVEAKFGRMIGVPQPEPLFEIIWSDGNTVKDHTRNPLLLMTASLNGDGPTTDLVRRMLTPEVKEGVDNGEYEVFKRPDPWARRQMMMIVVGRNQRELGERVDKWIDSLYSWAMEFEYDRLVNNHIRRYKNSLFEHRLGVDSGFRINLQPDYIPSRQNDSLGFIRFIRHYPDRWITIAWSEMKNAEFITPELVYERRKSIGVSFRDPVMTYDDRWIWEETGFDGRRAVLIRGLWATEGPIGGGPFITYGIGIPEKNLYFIVDGAVFSPGTAKMPYLWQLDTILRTFDITVEKGFIHK